MFEVSAYLYIRLDTAQVTFIPLVNKTKEMSVAKLTKFLFLNHRPMQHLTLLVPNTIFTVS